MVGPSLSMLGLTATPPAEHLETLLGAPPKAATLTDEAAAGRFGRRSTPTGRCLGVINCGAVRPSPSPSPKTRLTGDRCVLCVRRVACYNGTAVSQ